MGLDTETHIDQGEENMRFEKALSQHGTSIVYPHLPGPRDHTRRGCWKCLRTRVLDEYHDTVFSRHSRRAVHVNSCESKHKICTSTSQTKSPHQWGGVMKRHLSWGGIGSWWLLGEEVSVPSKSIAFRRSTMLQWKVKHPSVYESANWTWKI